MRWKPLGSTCIRKRRMNSCGVSVMVFQRPGPSMRCLPAERYATVIGGDEPAIGDGDPMGVARQIGQHGPRSAERTFGIDHPIDLAQRCQIRLEGSGVIEV